MPRPSLLALLLPLLPAVPAADVLVVSSFPGPDVDHTEIYQAVAAARSGDTILVRTGTYISFVVDGKDLVITGDEGAMADVGPITVRNLKVDQSLVLRGLRVLPTSTGIGVTVEDTLGPVWLEDLQVGDAYLPQIAKPGILVEDAASVTLVRGEYVGSRILGAAGLVARRSDVQLYGTRLLGGDGQAFLGQISPAGDGALVESGRLYAAGATFRGGAGGDDNQVLFCTDGGDGGAGLHLGPDGPSARLLDCLVEGGRGGTAVATCVPGQPGPAELVESGSVRHDPYAARDLRIDGLVREGAPLTVTVEGLRGDVVLLYQAAGQAPRYVAGNGTPVVGGVLLPGLGSGVVLFLGRVDASGRLVRTLRAPALPVAETFFSQGVVQARTGEVIFTGGGSTTVLVAP